MLKLKQKTRALIEITTPLGKVSIYVFGDGYVGIDAPKEWGIKRHELPAA